MAMAGLPEWLPPPANEGVGSVGVFHGPNLVGYTISTRRPFCAGVSLATLAARRLQGRHVSASLQYEFYVPQFQEWATGTCRKVLSCFDEQGCLLQPLQLPERTKAIGYPRIDWQNGPTDGTCSQNVRRAVLTITEGTTVLLRSELAVVVSTCEEVIAHGGRCQITKRLKLDPQTGEIICAVHRKRRAEAMRALPAAVQLALRVEGDQPHDLGFGLAALDAPPLFLPDVLPTALDGIALDPRELEAAPCGLEPAGLLGLVPNAQAGVMRGANGGDMAGAMRLPMGAAADLQAAAVDLPLLYDGYGEGSTVYYVTVPKGGDTDAIVSQFVKAHQLSLLGAHKFEGKLTSYVYKEKITPKTVGVKFVVEFADCVLADDLPPMPEAFMDAIRRNGNFGRTKAGEDDPAASPFQLYGRDVVSCKVLRHNLLDTEDTDTVGFELVLDAPVGASALAATTQAEQAARLTRVLQDNDLGIELGTGTFATLQVEAAGVDWSDWSMSPGDFFVHCVAPECELYENGNAKPATPFLYCADCGHEIDAPGLLASLATRKQIKAAHSFDSPLRAACPGCKKGREVKVRVGFECAVDKSRTCTSHGATIFLDHLLRDPQNESRAVLVLNCGHRLPLDALTSQAEAFLANKQPRPMICPHGCPIVVLDDPHHFKLCGRKIYERVQHRLATDYAAEQKAFRCLACDYDFLPSCVEPVAPFTCPNTTCEALICPEHNRSGFPCDCNLPSQHATASGAAAAAAAATTGAAAAAAAASEEVGDGA